MILQTNNFLYFLLFITYIAMFYNRKLLLTCALQLLLSQLRAELKGGQRGTYVIETRNVLRKRDRTEFLFFSVKSGVDFREGYPNQHRRTTETPQRKSRIAVSPRAHKRASRTGRAEWGMHFYVREVSRALRARRGWCGLVSLNLPAPRTTPRSRTPADTPAHPRTFPLANIRSAERCARDVGVGGRRRDWGEGAKGVTGPG